MGGKTNRYIICPYSNILMLSQPPVKYLGDKFKTSLGFDYYLGRGKIFVYDQDGILNSNHDGDYQVDVYSR